MILTVSYASEKIATESYARLVETMVTDPCEVVLFDNHYPLNRKYFMVELCEKYGFLYNSFGKNIGAYDAYNYLLGLCEARKAILYEGDNFPIQKDWHIAALKVIGGGFVMSTLRNKTSYREMDERGFTVKEINGVACRMPLHAVTNTIGAIDVPYFRQIGGFAGGKYYGGGEISMWDYLKDRWVFLDAYEDDREKFTHDWQYSQYKLLHAHRGMDMSFEDYLATKPILIENLANSIFT